MDSSSSGGGLSLMDLADCPGGVALRASVSWATRSGLLATFDGSLAVTPVAESSEVAAGKW